MWECNYAREPMDLKLLVLRLLRKIWVIILAAMAGSAVAAFGYYMSRTFPDKPEQYKASSSYYVEYAESTGGDNQYLYINSETWNQWVGEDVFLDFVIENLAAAVGQEGLDQQLRERLSSLEKEQLRGSLSASLQSDLFKPVSYVTMETPELADALNAAVQGAFFDFAGYMDGIDEIRLVNTEPAVHVERFPRLPHACILGSILGIFFAGLGMVIFFCIDDSIWVPGTFTYRYGVPMAGAMGKKGGFFREGEENLKYLFREKEVIGVTLADGDGNLEAVAAALKELLPDKKLVSVPFILQCPEEVEKLRETDGILLVVKAGVQNGKRIQRVLDFLKLQDCMAVAGVLQQADEGFMKTYYFGKGKTSLSDTREELRRWEQL